MFTSLNRMLMT